MLSTNFLRVSCPAAQARLETESSFYSAYPLSSCGEETELKKTSGPRAPPCGSQEASSPLKHFLHHRPCRHRPQEAQGGRWGAGARWSTQAMVLGCGPPRDFRHSVPPPQSPPLLLPPAPGLAFSTSRRCPRRAGNSEFLVAAGKWLKLFFPFRKLDGISFAKFFR